MSNELMEINEDSKFHDMLSKVLLSYISNGIKSQYIEPYSNNVISSDISEFADAWEYLQKRIPVIWGIEAPQVNVLSVHPKVRDIYGLPKGTEARYVPELKSIIVQKKKDSVVFTSVVVHEYIHYIQDIIGLFSHSIFNVLCPHCNSANISIKSVGRNILGLTNKIGHNVNSNADTNTKTLGACEDNKKKNTVYDYVLLDSAFDWLDSYGWHLDGISSFGFRLSKEFYYDEKINKIKQDFIRSDQTKFLVELYLNPERRIDSYKFFQYLAEGQERESVLDEEGSKLYQDLLDDVFEDLSDKQKRNIYNVIVAGVLERGFDAPKTLRLYRKNYSDDSDDKVELDNIEEAIELLGSQTPNQYQCDMCQSEFQMIPLTMDDAQNIMHIIAKFHYEQHMSAQEIYESFEGAIPLSIFERAISVSEFSRMEYFDRAPEVMAWCEQFEYIKSITDKNGDRKYSNDRIFEAYKKHFISSVPENLLSDEAKQAILLMEDMDFKNMFWRDFSAYRNDNNIEEIKKEKIDVIVKEYEDYFKRENLLKSNNDDRMLRGLMYLESLYSFIVNSHNMFYI